MMTNNEYNWNRVDLLKIFPAIMIAILIFIFSSLPNPLPPQPPHSEEEIIIIDINNVLHICEYAGFTFFIAFGLLDKIKGYYVLLLPSLYAITDEIHQYFVSNRFFDVMDIIFDLIGIALGFIAYLILIALIKRQRERKIGDS